VQPAGAPVSFGLELDGPASLGGSARLFPHDWRDGIGTLTASVTVTYPGGGSERLWSSEIATSRDTGFLEGVRFEVTVPHAATALVLGFDAPRSLPGPAVARGAWLEPVLRITDRDVGPRPPATDERSGRHLSRSERAAPLVSVLIPVHDPPLQMLREAIDSVREQTFGDWQICLVDDGSRDPAVISAVSDYAMADPRIVTARHAQAGGISAATNSGIRIADGDYIALLDHDDTLEPTALELVAQAITADPTLDMVYTDEDIVLDGRPVWTHIKPGWSPDTLRTNGYTCHLGVYRRSLVEEIGGFRTEFNGSQDVDMILRLTERTDRVGHVPEVLYHWRMHVDSTAGGDAKPYAYIAAARAIAGHLERSGVEATVGYGPPGLYRVVHHVDAALEVSIVIAVADAQGLAAAATGWIAQPHPSWRVICAAPADHHAAIHTTLTDAGLRPERITLIHAPADTDPATALATAAHAATTPQLLLCQTLATGITDDWLTRLIGYSQQPQIAAAGPVILNADGLIQDAGIAIPNGIPLPLLHGMAGTHGAAVVQNVAAVSGVLATSHTVHQQLGGLDPTYGPLTLTDYCLRARTHNLRTVIVPDARLTTTNPDTTTNDLPALRHLHATHTTPDPYYNSRYRDDRGDYTPRVRL
jgi:GT2 family glycosyltransferase